jgi:DNA-binding GntR family transcriptional regulator
MGISVGPSHGAWPGTGNDSWRAVGCAEAVPPVGVGTVLGTAPEEPVHTVRRVRMMHGQPVATELLYVPSASVPGLPQLLTPAAHAPAVLRELHTLALANEARAVELGSARAEDAKQLDRLPGAPVLVVTTRYRTGEGVAAVSMATYRADTCRLTFGDTGAVEITHHDQEHREAS